MENRRRKHIEKTANDLLHRYEASDSPGFDLAVILDAMKIKVVKKEFEDNISGFSVIDDGVKVVAVDKSQSPVRQRFTAAHELGHLQLHQDSSLNISNGVLFRDSRSSTGEDWMEVEANYFAACLLMPEKLLRLEIGKLKGKFVDESDVAALANKFNVSVIAMSIRLSSLGYV